MGKRITELERMVVKRGEKREKRMEKEKHRKKTKRSRKKIELKKREERRKKCSYKRNERWKKRNEKRNQRNTKGDRSRHECKLYENPIEGGKNGGVRMTMIGLQGLDQRIKIMKERRRLRERKLRVDNDLT